MKKLLISLGLVVLSTSIFAQSTESILSGISDSLNDIGFDIVQRDRYKLYPTENIYNFLKLDTATGQIDQVQWSLDEENEVSVSINRVNLANTNIGEKPGTFELYPTKNMYQFLLINKTTGRMWHVQWGMESRNRWIRPILFE